MLKGKDVYKRQVHGRCEIIREEHTAEGVLLEVYVDEEAANRLKSFAVEG